MPYDASGLPEQDEGSGGIRMAVFAAIACILAIGAMWFILTDAPAEDTHPAANESATYTLQLDCSNAALMHKYGMPTKADCMQYHVHGQWGWIKEGKLYAFDELPGDSAAWDELYGIEDNPAFDK